MPLGKNDAPTKATEAETEAAVEAVFDSGAGVPASMREAAEALPERNELQKHIKAAMLATDAQTEAKEKAEVVKLSPDSPETPSGAALLAVAGIADDQERGDEYARIKTAVRHGYVPAKAADLKAGK